MWLLRIRCIYLKTWSLFETNTYSWIQKRSTKINGLSIFRFLSRSLSLSSSFIFFIVLSLSVVRTHIYSAEKGFILITVFMNLFSFRNKMLNNSYAKCVLSVNFIWYRKISYGFYYIPKHCVYFGSFLSCFLLVNICLA